MSLGTKIVILFLILGAAFYGGSYAALELSVYPAFEEFEREAATTNLSRVHAVLQTEWRSLDVLANEYSEWDDTYEYAQGRNPGYSEENLLPDYWHSHDVDLVLLFDAVGNLLWGSLTDPSDGGMLSVEEEFFRPIERGDLLLTGTAGNSGTQGLLQSQLVPLMVLSRPILRNEAQGPVAGTFVIGRFLSSDRVRELGNRASVDLAIFSAADAKAPAHIQQALRSLSASTESPVWEYGAEAVRGHELLSDVFGDPAVVLEVSTPREISRIGSSTVRTAMIFIAAAAAIFLLAGWLFLQQLIVVAVKDLTGQMLAIGRTGNLDGRIGSTRADEIGSLSRQFDQLTATLRKTHGDLERARDEALAMSRAKSEFLARMSHEIRTPMNGVIGMTELLLKSKLDSTQRRFGDIINHSAESLLGVVNDILDFSRIEAGKLELDRVEFSVADVMEDAVDLVAGRAQEKGLELLCDIPTDGELRVTGDPTRFRQVLINLLGNAVKFTDYGEVVVRVRILDSLDGLICIRCEVVDTGIGIAAEDQAALWESFVQVDGSSTRRHAGTGLGLAISKQLVELMDGNIGVDSELGRGSTFWLEMQLPRAGKSEQPTDSASIRPNGRVLIVDDNATNREILERHLAAWQLQTVSAAGADEALQILDSNAARDRAFDVAVLDWHMPGVDGLTLAQRIRADKRFAQLPLILLSSVDTGLGGYQKQALGLYAMLVKPIRRQQLQAVVARSLRNLPATGDNIVGSSRGIAALKGKILLVEDNMINEIVATTMLEELGFCPIVARNGQEALDELEKQPVDVILMDCQMPVMDGFEATARIRGIQNDKARTPIIALTANAIRGDREKCLAVGMDDYISKPFTTTQLRRVLARWLDIDSDELQSGGHLPMEQCAGAAANGPPPIDAEALKRVAALGENKASFLPGLMETYLQLANDYVSSLERALITENMAATRDNAHGLKSSSANIGALRLADLCEQLEKAARQRDETIAAALLEPVRAEYRRVAEALMAHLEQARSA